MNGGQAITGISFQDNPPEVAQESSKDARTIVTTGNLKSGGKLILFKGNEREKVWTEYDAYFDVDQVNGTTVEYSATKNVDVPGCQGCLRNYLIQHNIETNETTVIDTSLQQSRTNTEWHDVDRVGENSRVYVDMAENKIYKKNVSTGIRTWSWELQNHRSSDTGYGIKSGDWSHMNDIEVVENGSMYMVSLRNHNEIIFIDANNGTVVDSIGGTKGVMYEQHNPDYIPQEQGGPAVVVADSENDRVVEYEKQDGEWVETWSWRDEYTSWTRDADRLPDGNTLIADSHNDRVYEVAPDGSVVWAVEAVYPYEVERLGTGDESSGGKSATALNLSHRDAPVAYGEYRVFFSGSGFDTLPWLLPWIDWWDYPFFFVVMVVLFMQFFRVTEYVFDTITGVALYWIEENICGEENKEEDE